MDRIIGENGVAVSSRLDLEIHYRWTSDNRFYVKYSYVWGDLDEKSLALSASGLSIVSPAIKGYLCCDKNFASVCLDNDKNVSALTDMDSLSIPETGQVALVKKGLLCNIYGAQNIMDAHRKGMPFMIEKARDSVYRDNLYDIVKSLEKKGLAYLSEGGVNKCNTRDFDEGLPSFMFSDFGLGIESKNYGMLIHDDFKKLTVNVELDDSDTIKGFKLPVLNKVRVYGPIYGFAVRSLNTYLAENDVGILGVYLEPSVGKDQS